MVSKEEDMKILSFLLIGFLILSSMGCAKKTPPESMEIMNPPPIPPTTQPMTAPESAESQPKKEGFFEKAGQKMDAGIKKAGEKTGEGLQKAGEGIQKGLQKTGEKIKDATD